MEEAQKHPKEGEFSQNVLSHQEIGQNLKFFFFDELSPGSCFFLPHGAKVYRNLQNFMREYYSKNGYQEVLTPNLFDQKLWEISGHWDKYKNNMFLIDKKDHHDRAIKELNLEDKPENKHEDDDKEPSQGFLSLKPMNCPSHCLMFKHMTVSYKQLPMRLADFGVLHRNEFSGALRGLTRVRRFQQDDSHIFCTMDQISDEITHLLQFIQQIYQKFGFTYKMGVSTRPKNFIGSIENWNRAEEILKTEMAKYGEVVVNEGDGAFYGPKIDITIKDSLGRFHQCGTIQLDFNLPERFGLRYTDQNNDLVQPVIIHRAILGSIERFMAILLEHTQGYLPFWLSPRQICVIPISEKYLDYAQKIHDTLRNEHQYETDIYASSDTLNLRIRRADLDFKFNHILVVGKKEMENGTVNVRSRNKKPQEMSLAYFLSTLHIPGA